MRKSILIILLLLSAWVQADSVPLPVLQQSVTDTAGLLNPLERDLIGREILLTTQITGHPLAVLVVNTTGDESIERFASRVFDQWRPAGSRYNGALLLLAKQDRAVRIEVGGGLKRELTTVQAEAIIQRDMLPEFRQTHYLQGLLNGTRAISDVLMKPIRDRAQAQASAGPPPASPPVRNPVPDSTMIFGWFAAMLILGVGSAEFEKKGRRLPKTLIVTAITVLAALGYSLLYTPEYLQSNLMWALIPTFFIQLLFAPTGPMKRRSGGGRKADGWNSLNGPYPSDSGSHGGSHHCGGDSGGDSGGGDSGGGDSSGSSGHW